MGVTDGVVVELDDEAVTLWSVSCQRPNAMTPMSAAATRRNPYFRLAGLFVTLRVIIGVPRGGMPPDSSVTSPCGCAIHPSTIPLLSSAAVRNLLPGLRTCPCRTWSWQAPHVPLRQPNSGWYSCLSSASSSVSCSRASTVVPVSLMAICPTTLHLSQHMSDLCLFIPSISPYDKG